MKYLAKIKYLGTNFCGFQVQPNARTVQGELTRAMSELFGAPCKITGCSRTDSGVHANEHVTVIDAPGATVPPERLPLAASRFLPDDISLFYAIKCDDTFHPRYDVVSKEYLYVIKNQSVKDPFWVGRAWFISRPIDEKSLTLMRSAAKHFIGKHDFAAFMSEGSDVSDTVRTVFDLRIEKDGDTLRVRISADGFLYNMVRIIVGTLVEVANGRIKSDSIPDIIYSRDRSRAGITSPPDGLYLNRVNYRLPDFQ
ncbi:MAG: tRNA pseudouridine(38-40) synthase TruA [Clostridia bacterium]|nr:tRNA pseudouridine(38-40) synthase TruA [Clostridia bacterium]